MMRLGSIEFINSLPVDLGILSGAVPVNAEVVSGPPAFLNKKILKKELEVSPVSAFFYAENQREFLILPDLSISSESGVESVLLFSRHPLKDLAGKKIAVTEKGRTTPALLEILCRMRYGFKPAIAKEGTDAFLLIGDEALAAREPLKNEGYQAIDLAEEWRAWTGLPIVFAVWVVRRDYFSAHAEEVFQIHRALLESKRWGLRHLDEILKAAGGKTGLSNTALQSYFSRLSYNFDENLRKGMRLYFDYAVQCGLLSPVSELEEIDIKYLMSSPRKRGSSLIPAKSMRG